MLFQQLIFPHSALLSRSDTWQTLFWSLDHTKSLLKKQNESFVAFCLHMKLNMHTQYRVELNNMVKIYIILTDTVIVIWFIISISGNGYFSQLSFSQSWCDIFGGLYQTISFLSGEKKMNTRASLQHYITSFICMYTHFTLIKKLQLLNGIVITDKQCLMFEMINNRKLLRSASCVLYSLIGQIKPNKMTPFGKLNNPLSLSKHRRHFE